MRVLGAGRTKTPTTMMACLALALLMSVGAGMGASPARAADGAFACDRYASSGGNDDTGTGTKEEPVQTLRTLASKLQPGETGCLKSGETFHMDNGWGIIVDGGADGQPITIRSAPEGRATVTGKVAVSADNLVLRGINFGGLGALGDTAPKSNHILVEGGDNVSILGNDITSPKGICLSVGKIESYTPEDQQSADPSKNFVLDGNRIHGCGLETTLVSSDSGMHGVYLAYTEDARVTNNFIYDNRVRGLQLYSRAERTLVEHNVIDGNSGNLNIGGSSHEGGYFVSRDTVVKNNIISNSTFAWHKDSAQVFGNYSSTAATDAYNNVVSGNCVYHRDPSKNFGGHGISQANNLTSDPMYVNRDAKNFALQTGSPCAGKGPQSTTAEPPKNAAPAIANVLPADGSNTTDARPPFSATVKDDSTVLAKSNIKLYVDGALMGSTRFAYDPATGALTRVFEDGIDPDFASGSHTIKVVATDAEGLSGQGSTTFTVGAPPDGTCLGMNNTRVGDGDANTVSGTDDAQDVVDARGGNDTIQDFANGLINKPYDRFCGGDGEDTFRAASRLGDPVILDGGNDSAGLADRYSDTVSYKLWTRSPGGTNNGVWVDLGDASPTGDGGGYAEALGLDHILHNISDVEGTLRDDSIVGNGAYNSLYGSDGRDRLVGKAGRDYLEGGAGNDAINVADGEADTVLGGSGQDAIDAKDGAKDTVDCGDGGFDSATVDAGLDVVSNCETADTTAPTGSISINNNRPFANGTAVTLDLSAGDGSGSGVTRMIFSNDGATWSPMPPTPAVPYALTHSWTLPAGDAEKTVYVRFVDDSGNYSQVYSDSITLDTVKPKVVAVAPSNNGSLLSTANVKATFDDTMLASSLRDATTGASATFKLKKGSATGMAVRAKVSYSGSTAVLNPNANLVRGATYYAVVTTGAKDKAGNALDQNPTMSGNQQKVWKFKVK